jgi:hypothetical protein
MTEVTGTSEVVVYVVVMGTVATGLVETTAELDSEETAGAELDPVETTEDEATGAEL